MHRMLLLPIVFCCACGPGRVVPERNDQSLIFPPAPRMSRGFTSVEQDGQTVTLTADLGRSQTGAADELKQIDIQRLASVCIVTEGRQDIRIGPVNVRQTPTHLYTAFSARIDRPGRVSFAAYQDRRLIDGLLKVVEPGKEWTRYRFILRVHQPVERITLRIQTDAAVEITDFGTLSKKPAAGAAMTTIH